MYLEFQPTKVLTYKNKRKGKIMSDFLKCEIKGFEDRLFKPKSKWLLENEECITVNYSHEKHGIQDAGGMFILPSTYDEYYFNNKGEIYHINYDTYSRDGKDFKYFNYDKDTSRNIVNFVSYFSPLTYDNEDLYKCYLTTENLYYNDEVSPIEDMTIEKLNVNIIKRNYQEYLNEISYVEKSIPTISVDEINKPRTKIIQASYDERWNTVTLYCTKEYFNSLGKKGLYKLLCSKLGY